LKAVLHKLIVAQIIKKFLAFCGTTRFVAAVTTTIDQLPVFESSGVSILTELEGFRDFLQSFEIFFSVLLRAGHDGSLHAVITWVSSIQGHFGHVVCCFDFNNSPEAKLASVC
jgi:hypothetical protein